MLGERCVGEQVRVESEHASAPSTQQHKRRHQLRGSEAASGAEPTTPFITMALGVVLMPRLNPLDAHESLPQQPSAPTYDRATRANATETNFNIFPNVCFLRCI